MTLPTSGTMSASMINLELGRAANAPFNIGGTQERALAGKPSGAISFADFYGKSAQPQAGDRQPPTGDKYDPPLGDVEGGTIWLAPLWGGGIFAYWDNVNIGKVNSLSSTSLIHNGWQYYRGSYKGEIDDYAYIYGIYRVKL